MRARRRAGFLGHSRSGSPGWWLFAAIGLVACGERDRGGTAPTIDSRGTAPPGDAVVATATATVQVAAPATPPRVPEIRLGQAVEVGPDGEPVPPKR